MKKPITIMTICILLAGCAKAVLPVDSTLAKPTPTSCVGMNYAIKGVVYAGSMGSDNAL
ncbi:MAG: hypothetical protein MUO76_01690 [Anaerolineaceae bacterium]|nr:hypothetical protein [Anaerolineaceae bacterium]